VFPRINDDALSNSHQVYIEVCMTALIQLISMRIHLALSALTLQKT